MFDRIPDASAPGAVQAYSAKSALFTADNDDRGTFFDSTGTFTITLDTTGMPAGWSAWFRTVSGTQTFDPSGGTLINGSTTYAVSHAGDVVLVEYTGSAFVISQTQLPASVGITGGTIDGVAINSSTIGATTPAAGTFTTLVGLSVAVTDTGGDHTITIDTASNEAANRTITIPALGGNVTLPLLEIAQSWTAINTFSNATASSSTTTGAVIVTGGVGIGGALYVGGVVTASSDADGTNVLGRAKIGSFVASDTAGFAHFDHASLTNFALAQVAAGDTYINAVTGRSIFAQVNNATLVTLTATTLTVASGPVVTVSNTTASTSTTTGALVVSGGIGVAGASTFGVRVGIGGGPNTYAILDMLFSGSWGGATFQNAIYAEHTFDSTVTNGRAFGSNPTLGASATATNLFHYWCTNASGSGTVTNQYGLYVEALSKGSSTNYAVYSAGAGNWFCGDTTASSSTTTGSVVIAGGVGIAGAVYVGGTINGTAAQAAVFNNASGSYTTWGHNGTLVGDIGADNQVTGGSSADFGITSRGGALRIATNTVARITIANAGGVSFGTSSPLTLNSTTASTSTATGALVVSGGCGVAGAGYFGGVVDCAVGLNIASGQAVTIGTTSNLMAGTATVHNFYSGSSSFGIYSQDGLSQWFGLTNSNGNTAITSTTASSSTTTGALVVSGGVGVAGVLSIGGATTVYGGSSNANLTLTVSTSGNERALFFTDTAGSKYNWKTGAQITTDNAWEIIPSTAAGGSTYSTATLRCSVAGVVTIPVTSGTTLVVSSTADASATFAGGATFGSVVVGSASTTARATLRIPHGTAPTSPVDGDVWTTSAGGLYVRINGVTVGPLT